MKTAIYCYSGSGNCLDMSKKIAKELGNTDIIMMRAYPEIINATVYDRVGFIFPCHGGGLPGDVEKFVRNIRVSPDVYKFGVVQYAGYMGCGLHKLDEIFGLHYWNGISNHCSCIWLMPHALTIPPTTLKGAQKRSDKAAKNIAADIRAGVRSGKKPPKNTINAIESHGMVKINKLINGKMSVGDSCISCGQCVKLCPRENISIVNGRASIGTNCSGCMSCVEYCPTNAINIGSITLKRERFHNANIKATDLMQGVIHID